MNKEYKIKLDLNKKLYNKKMAFNQFDENVNDFYIEVTKNNEVVKDLDKSIVTLVAIKPNGTVDAQFIEVKEGQIYADLKPSMCDLVGNYQAKAMIVLEGEIVTTDTINYSVNEDKIISKLNDDVVNDERFTLFTDALARLSDIEASEEQRIVNEAERILSEENRKIEEAKRVEAELIRQHEEADRTKYDAIRESNENIRKQNESIRLANETNRIDEESKRVEEENKRKLAEEERNANYNFMTEDEERRRSEANAHKEAENLRVQAETNRVNEEAKRRTTEQARVSAENTRVNNENTRKANEITRQTNETQRVEAETQRQNRYNSFIADAEANANNFENYTNNAKVEEEERKSNELDRKSQEDRRVSNEVERISNENTRKANEVVREKNEASRQNTFTNKVNEVDKKIVEMNTAKDNFISSINTKVDNKISEIDEAKSDMTATISDKVNEVETRFNALTSSQQQDAEVIDARDGETSLKARLDRDIEKAKQVYVNVEGSHISTDSSVGYLKDVEIFGNTIQDASNLADIRSVGDKVEGQELYEIPVLSRGKNLFDEMNLKRLSWGGTNWNLATLPLTSDGNYQNYSAFQTNLRLKPNTTYTLKFKWRSVTGVTGQAHRYIRFQFKDVTNKRYSASINGMGGFDPNTDSHYNLFAFNGESSSFVEKSISFTTPNEVLILDKLSNQVCEIKANYIQLEEGTQATPYEPYQEDKLTILSPVQLEKVGDVVDRLVCKDGVWGVEKNIGSTILDGSESKISLGSQSNDNYLEVLITLSNVKRGNALCDKFIFNTVYGDYELVRATENFIILFVKTSRLSSPNIEGVRQWLQANNTKVMYQFVTPQFIPLPHDQQVKLRTFANKTNISFGCEIEGTIKAQVPKSLGATVNTHTEQINNLNKELDRVKKLEESTVSTVTTESDFTTVEATSNGYFEDVKLEGKTLVNLCTRIYDQKAGTVIDNGNTLNYTKHPHYAQCDFKLSQNLKQNTTYTVVLNVANFVEGMSLQVNFYKYGEWIVCSGTKYVINKGVHTILLTTNENIADHIRIGKMDDAVESLDEYITLSKDIVILEGDHTQNPPSYFEGLKSVGQSATTSEDGVDEIVVSSVNENLVLNRSFHEQNQFNYAIKINDIKTKNLRVSNPFGKKIVLVIFNYNTNNWVRDIEVLPNTFINIELNLEECIRFINFPKTVWSGNNDYVSLVKHVIIGTDILNIDKKRLLYYNNETQSWEKPILRQWDSIEKHADGKYYYHQRSAEVVLNGSENWHRGGNSDSKAITSYFGYAVPNIVNKNYVCCDNFPGIDLDIVLGSYELEGVRNSSGNIYININKARLSEDSLVGFKAWLQANNVTVVYQLAEEKVYECTNIDLITYANETNYIVNSGAIVPRTTLKVHNNISNVVSLLQKKVSLLENSITSYMITQNRLMLASRYNADTVSFKVDVASFSDTFEYDNDLYELILNNILVGKDNYNREYIENLIIFYWMDFIISDEMYSTLFEIIEEQHNPKIEEER